jgi:hypothetical protein
MERLGHGQNLALTWNLPAGALELNAVTPRDSKRLHAPPAPGAQSPLSRPKLERSD